MRSGRLRNSPGRSSETTAAGHLVCSAVSARTRQRPRIFNKGGALFSSQGEENSPIALEGKTDLVNGAGGGVGHLAVQLAKWKGARVLAVASGKHEALLRDLGADQIIDYTKTTAETVAEDADLVVDAVGGPNMER